MGCEIWCDYCSGFRSLVTAELGLLCGYCGCTVARVTPQGLMYCEDCHTYRQPDYEEPRPAPEDDTDNAGYLVGDVTCTKCRAILMSVREPAAAAAG